MEIYIKPVKKASIAERKELLVQDISEVVADDEIIEQVKNTKIIDIKLKEKTSILVSVTDIVKQLKIVFPEHSIINLGEPDILIDYSPVKSKDIKSLKVLKIIFVLLILFTGSATAIMSFYTDSQMSKIFENMHYIFLGERKENPLIIVVPYCIGLASGIIVFFNHAFGKKIDGDPTPIEVEMSVYESSVTETMIDTLNTERIRDGNR